MQKKIWERVLMKFKGCGCFLILLVFSVWTNAASVERITFLSRQPGIFTENVRTAFNSQTNFTLVVWEKHTGSQEHHSIWGKLISPDGAPSGPAFLIINGPNGQRPRIAYCSSTNQFLLVYSNETSGENRFEIFAQRLNSSGRRAGKPIRISPAADRGKNINNASPQVIYDAKAQGYVVTWLRYLLSGSSATEQGLFGSVLNTDLTLRQTPVLMSPLQGDFIRILGPFVTDLGFHPATGKLLMAGFTESNNSPGSAWQYFVARADATLRKPQIVLKPLKSGLSSGAAPHASLMFLPGNNVGALFVEGTGVRSRKINSAGIPIGLTSLFFTGAIQTAPLEFPVAASSNAVGRSETVVVALDDSSMQTGKLWLQKTDSSGVSIGQPFELQSNFDSGASPAITALPIASEAGFWYAVLYIEGVRTGLNPNDSSGLVLLKVNTSP
jgi:hypothetical protein